jgi:pyruvate, orthophosphate dikinase
MEKMIYFFNEGDKSMKELLGGKGANLAEMTKIGIPVPQGFIVTTETCAKYYEEGKQVPEGLKEQIQENIKKLEEAMNTKFGSAENPLLLSIRSGAAVSMPGMMDTVLNLGLNTATVEGMITKTQNPRFVYDSYRRFIQMFGDVVMNVPHHNFEKVLSNMKATKGVEVDTDLTADDLKELVEKYKEVYKQGTGEEFPEDPLEQLIKSILAVFNSWNNNRAISYRRLNHIAGLKGTAVNVQAMVFGNMGETSGTGVCFSRDPSTGENVFYGEYLMNAQGEDVVAGIRTPMPISTLAENNPELYKELVEYKDKLEQHYKDMQDMEFTIQDGKLWMLQTRDGKRTAQAALKIAVDVVKEGLLNEADAMLKIDPNQLNQLLHKRLDPIAQEKAEVIARGLPASPGAAVGKLRFTAEDAHLAKEKGEKVILVRTETSPEDIEGMNASEGILTARGGMTSHAAVVARGMGKSCVAGCPDIKISEETKTMVANGETYTEDDWITLDGSAGSVMKGQVPTIDPDLSGDFGTIMDWTDKFRTLKVRTNADTPHDSKIAREFGAEGIGLCRTEHMFFEGDRIKAVREMILAEDLEGRKKALDKLLPMQKSDFVGIFKAMADLPVTIRLLDPPLHEFIPHKDEEIKELSTEMGIDFENLKAKVEDLKEFNPMLGWRGCRLAVTFPEIAEMQANAIISAAIEIKKEGQNIIPEIMIPLIGTVKELEYIKKVVIATADKLIAEAGVEMEYLVGTMIEIPRAALTSNEIAVEADFFSFGTNDLTQMTFGYSRDDSGKFLPAYLKEGILERDPFQALDQTGVGKLIKLSVDQARAVKPELKIGICGEHGGEPSSVEFCHKIGFNYVSCSPFRVPIARLAAAQAAIKEK